MTVYRIRNWEKNFENNRTKELKRMVWVPIPNKHDGDGFTELLDHPDGMAHYGAWHLLVQVASKCDPRGTLLRDGGKAHDPQSLARVSHGDAKVFEAAISRLVSIGWLETCKTPSEIPQEGAGIPQEGAGIPQEGAGIPQEGAGIPQEGATLLSSSLSFCSGLSSEGGPGETACPPVCREDHAHHWPLDVVIDVASRPTVGVTKDMATAFYDHFASIGWQDASSGKRRIVDLAARLRKWKTQDPSHKQASGGYQSIADRARAVCRKRGE